MPFFQGWRVKREVSDDLVILLSALRFLFFSGEEAQEVPETSEKTNVLSKLPAQRQRSESESELLVFTYTGNSTPTEESSWEERLSADSNPKAPPPSSTYRTKCHYSCFSVSTATVQGQQPFYVSYTFAFPSTVGSLLSFC